MYWPNVIEREHYAEMVHSCQFQWRPYIPRWPSPRWGADSYMQGFPREFMVYLWLLTTPHQEKKKKGPNTWRSLQSSFNILRERELTARCSAAEEGSTLDQQEKHRGFLATVVVGWGPQWTQGYKYQIKHQPTWESTYARVFNGISQDYCLC